MPNNPAMERAKDELTGRGIPFSEEYFLRYVRNGKSDVITLYLQAGISPNATLDGVSALALAINHGHKSVIKILLDAGANPDGMLDGLRVASPSKDKWERLGSLSGVFTFISSLLIAVVGWYFTQSYNDRQLALSQAQATQEQNNKAYQNRLAEMQTVEKMIPHLTKDESSKQVALIAISALASPNLAARIAEAYGGQGSINALAQLAKADTAQQAAPAIAALTNIASRESEKPDQPAHQALATVLTGREKAIAKLFVNRSPICNGFVVEGKTNWIVAPAYCLDFDIRTKVSVQFHDGGQLPVVENRITADGLLVLLKLEKPAPASLRLSTKPVTRGSAISQIAFDLGSTGNLQVVVGQVQESREMPFFAKGGEAKASGFKVRLSVMEKKPTGSGGGPLLDAEGNVACMTFQGDQTGNEECLAASVIRANLASIPAE